MTRALLSFAFALLAGAGPLARCDDSPAGGTAMPDAYVREARLAGAALEALEASGRWPSLALELAELPPAEAMPIPAQDGKWAVWTFSTRATKDRDQEPVIRFALVPRNGVLAWRSTMDTVGTWFEPDLFHIDDDFAVFSRRGPSMAEDVVAAREDVRKAVAKLLGAADDAGEDAAPELAKKGLSAGIVTARKHDRHLEIEVTGGPLPLDKLAQEYPLYWINVAQTPDQGPVSVTWNPPAGLANAGTRDPHEAHPAADPDARRKLAESEGRVAAIGLRLVEAWKAKPKADAAERRAWVEKAGPEILAEYQKSGVYIPGTNRHQIDQKKFARYLGVLD